MRSGFVFILLLIVSSCSSIKKSRDTQLSDIDSNGKIRDLEKILASAEDKATPQGKTVLSTGRGMVEENKVVRGSCWDYANAVYNNSGYKADKRVTPLKSKYNGPYADLSTIQAGDWLYFINYSFKESDHSGIFVEWTDREKNRAVILSYIGGRKKKPGSYKIYDLRHVYYIIRPF